jgi:hypothetical protein
MPIFDFKNDWRDIHFRESDAGPDSSTQDSKTQADGNHKPVLSFYFWIYLIVSFSLAAVTVFGWWRYTRTNDADSRKRTPKQRRISYTAGNKQKVENLTFFAAEYEGGKDTV